MKDSRVKILEQVKKKLEVSALEEGIASPIRKPKSIEFLSTGLASIDNILGGGFPKGKIVELWGTPGCGKTTLALHAIMETQAKGVFCVFIDAEHAFNPDYAKTIGVCIEQPNLIFVEPEWGEVGLEAAEEYAKSGVVGLIIIDSVASLVPKATVNRAINEQEQAQLARLMSRGLSRIVPILANSETCLVFINQIRDEVGKMYGNKETTPGGKALKYHAFQRLELRHIEYLSKGDVKIGDSVKAVAKKTKAREPFRESMLRLIFGKGFDKTYDKFQTMLKKGEIQKSGGWYYLGDSKFQGEEQILAEISK